jgi:fructose-6-phosphate aldolase 2
MIYMADTVDLNELRELYSFFTLDGVPTNPTILSNAGYILSVAIEGIQELVGTGMVHVQMISAKSDDMVREARKYRSYFDFGDNFYAKIPVTASGYRAMNLLKDAGINVTATAIFTQQQALVAMKAGADFVAPYVSRLDNISSHGIEVVGDIVQNIFEYNLKGKLLATSFKTVVQIYRVSMAGAHSATIGPELLHQLIKHPMTDIGLKQFEIDADGIYDIDF